MRKILDRVFSIDCAHRHTLVVRSGGLTRVVCESCGLLSFSFDPGSNQVPKTAPTAQPLIPADL